MWIAIIIIGILTGFNTYKVLKKDTENPLKVVREGKNVYIKDKNGNTILEV